VRRVKARVFGQFVADNTLQSHHRASLSEVRKEVVLEKLAEGDSSVITATAAIDQQISSFAKLEEAHGVLPESDLVNIRGVMRLMLTENNLIYKINCVHFTSFG